MELSAVASDLREAREGSVLCTQCRAEFRLHRGVAHLMPNPPEHVAREAAGLERFAEQMRADGWDADKIRRLPDIHDGYWYVQGQSMQQILTTIDFQPGDWVLDVGSNTCWASNRFAQRGQQVIALDIATPEMQGLYTADFFIQPGISYFERVQGSMSEMPLASNSVDYVFCCEVLHHNDQESLRRTFEEIFRVLKPGGRLAMVNETLKTRRDPIGVHVEGVEQFEGYEHAHWALRYRGEAIRAGFRTQLLEPSYHWFFRDPPAAVGLRLQLRQSLRSTQSYDAAIRTGALQAMKRKGLGRRAYLAWIYHVAGGTQMSMIATKPQWLLGPADAPPPERVGRSLVASAATSLRGLRRRVARGG